MQVSVARNRLRRSLITLRFSLLASRFSLLASRFSLLASRFSLLASRFSLLASRFSLLASRFSLLLRTHPSNCLLHRRPDFPVAIREQTLQRVPGRWRTRFRQ